MHKIRPATWYSERGNFPVFGSLEHFLSGIEQTVWQNPKTREESSTWKNKFLKSYKDFYNIDLDIPRWDDIKSIYNPKKFS